MRSFNTNYGRQSPEPASPKVARANQAQEWEKQQEFLRQQVIKNILTLKIFD